MLSSQWSSESDWLDTLDSDSGGGVGGGVFSLTGAGSSSVDSDGSLLEVYVS